MAIKRKATFQPYDMDTAIGTNNSGVLMFGYSLEDTDTVSSIISGGDEGGTDAPVFNAQDSVLWNNLRDAFRGEIAQMYRELRTSGAWSAQALIKRAQEHQGQWCEAIYNEDEYFKHLIPLIDPVTKDEQGNLIRTDRYLTMLQGSKEEQRKWWLTNRFRYMDSKYVTGDAVNSVISMRVFNNGTLKLKAAIDLYLSVRFGGGSTPLLLRKNAGEVAEFPYVAETGVTEMETWIYSADLITDVGDLSVFYGNEFDFSRATRLQRLKIGDSASAYSNANLKALDVRNSALLEYIDVRNCPNLAITVNLEGSPRLKEAYFDGTSITGCDLADGCSVETLHLPGTITTLTLINLNKLSDFVCPDYSHVSRLMLSNMDAKVVDHVAVLRQIPANSQVNIQGLYLEMAGATEIEGFLDLLDTMRGVSREKNASGEWMYHDYDTAQVSGTIHTASLTGAQIASYNQRYPYLTITADHTTSILTYKTYDGSSTLYTETIYDGGNGTKENTTTRPADARYTYTPNGWSKVVNGSPDANALVNVVADRTVYAAYDAEWQKYRVRFYNGSTLMKTVNDVLYGGTAEPPTETPVYSADPENYEFNGWSPSNVNIEGNTDCYAQYTFTGIVARKLIDRSISGDYSNDRVTSIGVCAFNSCTALTTADFPVATSISDYAFQNCPKLTTVNFPVATSIGGSAFYSCPSLTTADFPVVTSIGSNAFKNCSKLTTVNFPVVTSIGSDAFYRCSSLTTADFPVVTSIGSNAFKNCSKLTTVNFPVVTSIGSDAFNSCTALTTADFPVATSISDYAFQNCPKLTTVNFPVATSIGGSAFYSCPSLTTADFPVVTSIGSNAFQNCSSLTTLILRNTEKVATLGNVNAFQSANKCIIYVPDDLVDDYKTTTNWSAYADRIKGLSELPA